MCFSMYHVCITSTLCRKPIKGNLPESISRLSPWSGMGWTPNTLNIATATPEIQSRNNAAWVVVVVVGRRGRGHGGLRAQIRSACSTPCPVKRMTWAQERQSSNAEKNACLPGPSCMLRYTVASLSLQNEANRLHMYGEHHKHEECFSVFCHICPV